MKKKSKSNPKDLKPALGGYDILLKAIASHLAEAWKTSARAVNLVMRVEYRLALPDEDTLENEIMKTQRLMESRSLYPV